jgi:membrane-bound lytic murein transglycosylase D
MMLKKFSGLGICAILGLGFCTAAFAQQDRAGVSSDAQSAPVNPSATTKAAPQSASTPNPNGGNSAAIAPTLKLAQAVTPPAAIATAAAAKPAITATPANTAQPAAASTANTANTLAPATATTSDAVMLVPATAVDGDAAVANDDATELPVETPGPVSVPSPPIKVDALAKEAYFFPRYPQLTPAVTFWTRIFGEYSENQSVIHSMDYPQKIFKVLDFRDDAARMNPVELSKVRAREEKIAKDHFDEVLQQVHDLRRSPEQMNSEQRRVFEMYADIPDDNRFRNAIGTLRAQRGLKERTRQALDTSGKYLPTMESTFRGYQLPVTLTRLPLVESSFNVEAYSKAGAAGLWQFIPSSARIYMRLDNIVDDRRDPWTSTDAAARHLKDDYSALGDWPLAITAYNHGRGGISRALTAVGGKTIIDLIERFDGHRFGFASKNYYAEFLAAVDVARQYARSQDAPLQRDTLRFDLVETKHYVPYETLRRLCGADDELFRKLNPAYRPEVIEGKMYVPPGHLIRVPAGSAKSFEVAYSKLSSNERFDAQRAFYQLHKVQRGDSIAKIARHYGVSQSAIVSANGLGKQHLRIGQIIKVPPHIEQRPGPVTVAVGESKPQQTRAQKRAELVEAAKSYPVHKVKSGQTLSGIAKRYNTSVASLREVNNLGDSSHLKPGMKLKIPPTS